MIQNFHKWMLFIAFVGMTMLAQAQKNARYHTVEEGQTLYSIARIYGISAKDLQKLNPESGDLIRPGDKLRIPDNAQAKQVASGPGAQFVGSSTSTPQNAKGNIKTTYQIKKKDTLYRIALEHNLTIQEIIDANPGLTEEGKLKKGEWISIPYSRAEKQAEANRVEAERAAKATAKKSHKSHLNIAVILPLKENTERGGKMVEFYQGMLMAADSIRKQGISVDYYTYHSGSSVADINTILQKDELKHMDAIFGPLDGVQANVLNTFSEQNKVRLVMPFSTTNSYAGNNPYAYVVSASMDKVNRYGAELVGKRFPNHNIVILNAGTADNRANSFISHLAGAGISTHELNADADNQIFSTTLSTSRKNVIILNSSSQNALQKAIQRLRAFMSENPNYKISLLGYPEWSTYQGRILKSFGELDTYVYAPFYRNVNDTRIANFEQRFKNNFHHELIKTTPRYGIMGLDVAYYFLNGLAKFGDYFDEKQQTFNYSPLQNNLVFTQPSQSLPFTNTNITLIHYTPSGSAEVLR